MNLEQQINAMYHDLLLSCGVHYLQEANKYIVFNNTEVLFCINYNKIVQDYEIERSPLLLEEYKKYNIEKQYVPALSDLYDWVCFQYVIYDFFKTKNKNVEKLFQDTVPSCDIEFQMGKNFATYNVYGQSKLLYAVGYNPKTKQYGFKRYEKMLFLYDLLNLPMDKKPNYVKLYKQIEDQYLLQCAVENIRHIYEI